MNVKELKEFLNSLPPEMEEAEIVCQSDSEGNGYSPLAGADADAIYEPESSYSGIVYTVSWEAEEACKTKKEWATILKKPRCVVLWPIN